MANTDTLTLRLPAKLKQRLAALAKSTDRSQSRLAADAIEHYVELNAWQLEAIEDGIRAADAGDVVSHKHMKAFVRSWGKSKK